MVDPGPGRGETGYGPREGHAPERSGGGEVTLPAAPLRRPSRRRQSTPGRPVPVRLWEGPMPAKEAGTGAKREPKPRSSDRGVAQLALREGLSAWPLLTSLLDRSSPLGS